MVSLRVERRFKAWSQSNHPAVKEALLDTAIPLKGSDTPALAGPTTFGERATVEKVVVNVQVWSFSCMLKAHFD